MKKYIVYSICSKFGKIFIINLIFCSLTANSTYATHAPEPQRHSTNNALSGYILERLPILLNQLHGAAVLNKNTEVKSILELVRLEAPEKSYSENYPNAYAFKNDNKNFVVIETQFAKNIFIDSCLGTLYATQWDNANELYQSSCKDYKSTFDPHSSELLDPYWFNFDKYLGKTTYHTNFARNLLWELVDSSIVWYLLHEVSHHLLKHDPEKSLSLPDSRKREMEADRKASSLMREMGYSLFYVTYYLYGLTLEENCLQSMSLILPEDQSTHPSFSTRYLNIIKEFNVWASPKTFGYLTFYVPFHSNESLIQNAQIAVPDKNSPIPNAFMSVTDYPTRTISNFSGAYEWNNNTLHIYFKNYEDGDRVEYLIPDTSKVYNALGARYYNSDNKLIGETNYPCFFKNPREDFIILPDKRTVAENRKSLETGELFLKHLKKVGASENLSNKILKALLDKNYATKRIVLSYHKGKIDSTEFNSLINSEDAKFQRNCELYLGKDRAKQFNESVSNDPIMRIGEQFTEINSENALIQTSNSLIEKNPVLQKFKLFYNPGQHN
jgi:hypothetical protein